MKKPSSSSFQPCKQKFALQGNVHIVSAFKAHEVTQRAVPAIATLLLAFPIHDVNKYKDWLCDCTLTLLTLPAWIDSQISIALKKKINNNLTDGSVVLDETRKVTDDV